MSFRGSKSFPSSVYYTNDWLAEQVFLFPFFPFHSAVEDAPGWHSAGAVSFPFTLKVGVQSACSGEALIDTCPRAKGQATSLPVLVKRRSQNPQESRTLPEHGLRFWCLSVEIFLENQTKAGRWSESLPLNAGAVPCRPFPSGPSFPKLTHAKVSGKVITEHL